MLSSGNLTTLSYLRLQPLPRRRLRPVVACSPGNPDEGEFSAPICWGAGDDTGPGFPSIKPTAFFRPRTHHPRDVKIDFGRHKDERLGTLPPSYLNWLSGLSDPYWSSLAKQVLEDPVYQDRIEWEPVRRLFGYDGEVRGSFFWREGFDLMKAYREIGESYGWDMDDKEAWKKVTLDLIGTSYSGRIPRKKGKRSQLGASESVQCEESIPTLSPSVTPRGAGIKMKKESVVGGKRAERIERMRLKREKVPAKIEDKGEVNDREELGYLDDQNVVKKGKNSGVLVGRTPGFVGNQNSVEKGRNSGVLVGRTQGYVDNQNGVEKGRSSGLLAGGQQGDIIDRIRRKRNAKMVKNHKAEEQILEEKEERTPTIKIKKERISRRNGYLNKGNRELGGGRNDEMISFAKSEQNSENGEIFNPFPGREALLKKIMSKKER